MNPERNLPDWILPFLILCLLVIGFTLLAGDGASPIIPLPTPTATPGPQESALLQQTAGDLRTAAESWRTLLETEPENARAHYNLGLLLSLLDPANAAPHLDRAAELDPIYQEPVNRLKNTLRLALFAEDPAYKLIQIGQVLAAVEEWGLAKIAFENVVVFSPGYAEAWAYLAEAQYRTGEDSLTALENAITLNPDSLTANILFGLYWQRQGQPELSLDYFQRAADLEPGNLYLQIDIAYLVADLGNFNEGMERIQRIVENNPENASAWLTIANFCLHYSYQVEETGLPAARQAVLLDENNPEALTTLGRAYSHQGDFLLAERFFNQTLQASPNYLPGHYYLGFHYLTHNQFDLAQAHLQTVIDLAPNDPLAIQAQDFLDRYLP